MLDRFSILEKYRKILQQFFADEEEAAFYAVSELGKELVLAAAGPDILIDIHSSALKEVINESDPIAVSRMVINANDLLLNSIMAYAMTYYGFMEQLAVGRKKLELAKNEAELERDKLDNIISAIDADLLLLDPELKILWVNKHLAESSAKDASEIIGKPCNLAYCNRTRKPENCPALRVLRSRKLERMDQIIEQPNQAPRYYNFTCSPILDAEGNITAILELIQDVTTQHDKENQLKLKNEELKRLNKLFVDRELRIIELKNIIKDLKAKTDTN